MASICAELNPPIWVLESAGISSVSSAVTFAVAIAANCAGAKPRMLSEVNARSCASVRPSTAAVLTPRMPALVNAETPTAETCAVLRPRACRLVRSATRKSVVDRTEI